MEIKTIEIRDRATFIPALAVRLGPRDERDRYLCGRAGYGTDAESQRSYVLLLRLEGGETQYAPYAWTGSRTMRAAHEVLLANWDVIENGAVVDVEYCLGERAAPKVSEAEVY